MPATYFVTSSTHGYRQIFQSDKLAELFLEHLRTQRDKHRLLLHDYIVMPDHVHLLFTTAEDVTLEKAMQFIKGGFSFAAKESGTFLGEVWLNSYHDSRIRDANECAEIVRYIRLNPVRRHLVTKAEEFRFSSAHESAQIDPLPQWLKPR